MSDHVPYDRFPYELVVEILARLPVISLLRYKSVCKSWYSLITSPSFVTKHLNHCKNKLLMRIYRTGDRRVRYHIFRVDVRCGDECSKLKFPYREPFGRVRIVGSCNGLLCICENSYTAESNIIVWNPSIGKSITLPKPQVVSFIGFGAHPTTNEYKVVRILSQKNPKQHKKFQRLVELYTQGTTSWRGLDSSFPPDCLVECNAPQAFVNGAVNWIAEDASVSVGYQPLIMSFNMSAETFDVMMLPPPLEDQKPASLSVHIFQESLAVSCGQQRGKGNMAYWIWVMKEYGVPGSWTKLISFEVNHPLLLVRPLGVLGNGKVLLSKMDDPRNPISDHQLLSYDIVTKAVTDTKIRGLPLLRDPFMETLVSV